MKPKQIKSLDDLYNAAIGKKAIVCRFPGRIPAAFVINMQGIRIHQLIQSGMYVYTPKKR